MGSFTSTSWGLSRDRCAIVGILYLKWVWGPISFAQNCILWTTMPWFRRAILVCRLTATWWLATILTIRRRRWIIKWSWLCRWDWACNIASTGILMWDWSRRCVSALPIIWIMC